MFSEKKYWKETKILVENSYISRYVKILSLAEAVLETIKTIVPFDDYNDLLYSPPKYIAKTSRSQTR